MFLKSLVVRGFKSFPDKTNLFFEPGVTVIVGPNGSGKSNLIEAISWVLGEQGPRSLRGGKMEDVIFAGSPARPALGMAEVSLTIDNSAGVLPIDFTEVTISRILFRSGDSEYRLNGQVCRLLDIQEVLSDTGIGREQHTIIGQGQLDEILQADPEQMRLFIEEAAGVAKHRRRKERALRKISSTEQNLARLSDLVSEIRRQLRPLREAAEVAKRHATLNEDLSKTRLVMSARELAALRNRVGSGLSDPSTPVREKEAELTGLEHALTDAEREQTQSFTDMEKARDAAWSMSRSAERLTSLNALAAEREKTLRAELAGTTAEAAAVRTRELNREKAELEGLLTVAKTEEARLAAELAAATAGSAASERALTDVEERLFRLRASRRDISSELVRVHGEMAATTASLEAAGREMARVAAREKAIGDSRLEAETALDAAREQILRLESEEAPLSESMQELESELQRLEAERSSSEKRLREMDRKVALWKARSDIHAGEPAARRLSAAGLPGVIGLLADLVEVPAAYKKALAAVAGPLHSVIVISDPSAVSSVLAELGEDEGIGILVSAGEQIELSGAAPITTLLMKATPEAAAALAGVFVVDELLDAAKLAQRYPGATFVTPEGGVASGRLVARGPADAAERADELQRQLSVAESEVTDLDRLIRVTRTKMEGVRDQLNSLDAALAGESQSLSSLDRDLHALDREFGAISEVKQQSVAAESSLASRMKALEGEQPRLEGDLSSKDAEIQNAESQRAQAHTERSSDRASLESSNVEAAGARERRRLIEERLEATAARIEEFAGASGGIENERSRIESELAASARVGRTAATLREAAQSWSVEAEGLYQGRRQKLRSAEAAVGELRTKRAGLAGALEDLRERARREDVDRSELRVRVMMLEEKLREEWDFDPDRAVDRLGHVWEVEEPSMVTDPLEKLALMDDESLRRRRARLERDLEVVGRVNPLAAQEFESLQERESFLMDQMNDVRRSRRDLFKLLAEIDAKIREMFVSAFEDVANEYERLFSALFPGGEGRMRLTDPSEPLLSGVEVEARPGGKNLKRLSLLSGGEKALSALAILFAIFRTRPSPFYVLDEVEAALDDINLHRFLQLLLDFRSTSQLLVVTHQKRTMEAADVLYGVSIRGDGASRVISQRMPSELNPRTRTTPAPQES